MRTGQAQPVAVLRMTAEPRLETIVRVLFRGELKSSRLPHEDSSREVAVPRAALRELFARARRLPCRYCSDYLDGFASGGLRSDAAGGRQIEMPGLLDNR